jgi:hypothetical protein
MQVCLKVLVVASRHFVVVARVHAEPRCSSVSLQIAECTECYNINNYIRRLGLSMTVGCIIN